jgi:hypothetical protein
MADITSNISVKPVTNLMYFDIPAFNNTELKKSPGYNFNNVYIDIDKHTMFCDVDIYSTNINNNPLSSPTGVYTTTSTVTIDNKEQFDQIFNLTNLSNYILASYQYVPKGQDGGQNDNIGARGVQSIYSSQTNINTVELKNVVVNWTYNAGPTGYIGSTSDNGGNPQLISFTVPFIKFDSILSYKSSGMNRSQSGPVPPNSTLETPTTGITPLSYPDSTGVIQTIFNKDIFINTSVTQINSNYDSSSYISVGYNPFTQTVSYFTYVVFPVSGTYYVTNDISLYYILVGGGGSGGGGGYNVRIGGGAGGTLIANAGNKAVEVEAGSIITVEIGNGGSGNGGNISGNPSTMTITSSSGETTKFKSAAGGNGGSSTSNMIPTATAFTNGGKNTNNGDNGDNGYGGNGNSTNNRTGYNGPSYTFYDDTGSYNFAGGGGAYVDNTGYLGGSNGGGSGATQTVNASAQMVPITINGNNVSIYVGSGGGGSESVAGGNGGLGVCVIYYI